MTPEIRDRLFKLADENYRAFSSRLMPGIDNIIGVRMPDLRKIAKQIAKEDWRLYFNDYSINQHSGNHISNNHYFEETMLEGLILGYAKTDFDEIAPYIKNYGAKINNWALCDSFCIGLKITRKNPDAMLGIIKENLASGKEFHVRFGAVMLLCHYVDEKYIDKIFVLVDKVKANGYYAQMAIAWLISECFAKFPEKTMDYLKKNRLDNFTFNKTLQKITESRKISDATKKIIKSMKRKL